MKKVSRLLIGFLMVAGSFNGTQAQESSWTTGVDLVSSYIWRGTKFGSGPAFQPSLEYAKGGFAIGAWGNYCFSDNQALESDLYMSLTSKSGLGITVSDYYFPTAKWFKGSSHYIEPMISFKKEKFSLLAAYMLGDGVKDLYLEAGVTAGPVNLTLGAGDGQYTAGGKFNVCNIGLSTSKEVKITESFSLPVSGSLILNPSSEQFFIVVGISL